MSLVSWLRHYLPAISPTRTRAYGAPRQRPTIRPCLEALEERWLPSTLTVTSTADSGAGSLRAEIAAANPGDTINFASSLAGQTIALANGELVLNKSLTIQGLGGGQSPVTISGLGISRVFEIDGASTNVALSGLNIIGGVGIADTASSHTGLDGKGGAIWNAGTLTLSSCSLSSNTARGTVNVEGGAIYNAGVLTLTGSSLSNNSSYSGLGAVALGGAIYNSGTLKVTGSTLENNSVGISSFDINGGGDGGAIYNAGTLTVSNSTVSDNGAYQDGGHGGDGGGIFNASRASATVTGTTLSKNVGYFDGLGGGIYNAGTMTASGDTVSGNVAYAGGGIYNTGKLTVGTSSFSGNYPDAISGHYTDKGGNTFS